MNWVVSVNIACWAIFVIYWILNARAVKPSQPTKLSQSSRRYVLISVIFVFLILNYSGLLAFLRISPCKFDWRGCHLNVIGGIEKPSPILSFASIILTVMGMIVAIIASRMLAGNWSAAVDLKVGHELVTHGIYGYIRHPIYSGVFCMVLGMAILYQSWLVLIMVFLMLGLFIMKMITEETLMAKTFPKNYPAYKKRVRALIPYIL